MPHVILRALAPIFFVMALGYVAGRRRGVDNQHVGELNALVMDYALPASLFVATASTPSAALLEQAPLYVFLGVIMLAPYPLWYLFERRVARKSSGEAATAALTVTLPNYAAAGLPIVAAILGPAQTVQVAVAIAAGSILPSPLTLLLLELGAQNGQTDSANKLARVRGAVMRALTKPIVLAPVCGGLLSLSGVRLDAILGASIQLIGQAAGGVALFLTGLILSRSPSV